MQELQELLAVAESLRSDLPRLSPPSEAEGRQAFTEALRSVLAAVDRTRAYLIRLREGGGQRVGHGAQALRLAWAAAAADLLPLDEELADRCRLRAHYWSEASTWSEHEAETTWMALEEAWKTAETMLSDAGVELRGRNDPATITPPPD